MSDVFHDLAGAFAKRWFIGVPSGDDLSGILSVPLEAAMRRIHDRSGTGRTRQADAWVSRVFGVEEKKLDAGVIDRLSQTMISMLPANLQSLSGLLAGLQTPPRPPLPPSKSSTEVFDPGPLLKALSGNPTALGAVKSFFPPAAALTVTWDPQTVRRMLEALFKRLGPAIPHSMRQIRLEFEAEMLQVPSRVAAASAIAAGQGLMAPHVAVSSAEIGTIVGNRLRDIYVARFPANKVTAERRVYQNGGSRSLYVAALEDMATDWSLMALNMSRITSPDLALKRLGYYRDDIIDFTFGLSGVLKTPVPVSLPSWLQVTCLKWEIKPALSAPLGVPQELYYRYSYRVWAALFRDVSKGLVRTAAMWPGFGWDALDPTLYRPFQVQDRMIKPFSLDAVPGIIFYFTFKGLTAQEVEVLVVAFWMAMKDKLAKLRRASDQLDEALAKALQELEALARKIAEIYAVVMFAQLIIGLCVVAVILAFTAGPELIVAALIAGVFVLIFSQGQGTPQGDTPTTTITLGSVVLKDCPISLFNKAVPTIEALYRDAMEAVAQSLQNSSVA